MRTWSSAAVVVAGRSHLGSAGPRRRARVGVRVLLFAGALAFANLGIVSPASASDVSFTATLNSTRSVSGTPVFLTIVLSDTSSGSFTVDLVAATWTCAGGRAFVPRGSTSATLSLAQVLGNERCLGVGTWQLVVTLNTRDAAAPPVSLTHERMPLGAEPGVTMLVTPNPADTGEFLQLRAWVSSYVGTPDPLGTIAFSSDGSPLGTAQVKDGAASLRAGPLSLGEHSIVASYLDAAGEILGQSEPFLVTIGPDVQVSVDALKVTPTTFYPVGDGYLDTTSIRGTLREKASVTARIYSKATGKLVRTLSAGSVSSAYSLTWNGKSASGLMQPAGVYKVVQTISDVTGNTVVREFPVTLSLKRMYYRSVTVTKTGAAALVEFDGPDYTVYRYGTEITAINNRLSTRASGYLLRLGWTFSLPKVVVGKMSFEVLSSCPPGTSGAVYSLIGESANDDPMKGTGCTYGWHKLTVPVSSLALSGTSVTGAVYVWPGWMNWQGIRVSKVRLTYSAGTLR